MADFESEELFINSRTNSAEKLKAIDLIIDALYTLAASAAGKDDVEEYSLDDGQTKIRTKFRGLTSITKAILSFEQLRSMHFNRLNGHVIRLVDSKSTAGHRNH